MADELNIYIWLPSDVPVCGLITCTFNLHKIFLSDFNALPQQPKRYYCGNLVWQDMQLLDAEFQVGVLMLLWQSTVEHVMSALL